MAHVRFMNSDPQYLSFEIDEQYTGQNGVQLAVKVRHCNYTTLCSKFLFINNFVYGEQAPYDEGMGMVSFEKFRKNLGGLYMTGYRPTVKMKKPLIALAQRIYQCFSTESHRQFEFVKRE